MNHRNPFKYFNSSPQIIKLAVLYYIKYPLSFRQVEDILSERGIDICHETIRFWVNRFGPEFAKSIRKKRIENHSNWQWHLDDALPDRVLHSKIPRGFLSKSTVNDITFGGPLTMKAKCWNVM